MDVSTTTGMPFKYFHFRWKSYTFMEKILSKPVKFRTNLMGSIEWNLQLKCFVFPEEDLADFEFVLTAPKHVSDSKTVEFLSIYGFLKFSEKPGEVVAGRMSVYNFGKIYSADFRHPTTACVRNGGFCLDIIMYPNSCPMDIAKAFAERSNDDIMDNKEFYAEKEDETMLLSQLKTLVEENTDTYDFTVKCMDKIKLTHKFIIYNRLGNFTGEKIRENVESGRKSGEIVLDTTADIFDALLRYAHEAVDDPIKRLLGDPTTRIDMLRCLVQYKMWKVFLHLTPDYSRYDVYTLGDQGRQNFSINFPLVKNANGEFYYFFKRNLKLQPPTFAEGAVITLNFFGNKTLNLCVYVRLLQPAAGIGTLKIQHERTGYHSERNLRITLDREFFVENFGEVLSASAIYNNYTVIFKVDFHFSIVTGQETVKQSVESHAYSSLESLRRDMRNAYLRKIYPDCTSSSNESSSHEVMKIATHKLILKYRLNLPDGWMNSDFVPLPLSKESLSLLLEYAYCGTISIPFASQNALNDLEALFNRLDNKSVMLERLIKSLKNYLKSHHNQAIYL